MVRKECRQEGRVKRCAQLSALAFEYPMEGAEQPPEEYARRLIANPPTTHIDRAQPDGL